MDRSRVFAISRNRKVVFIFPLSFKVAHYIDVLITPPSARAGTHSSNLGECLSLLCILRVVVRWYVLLSYSCLVGICWPGCFKSTSCHFSVLLAWWRLRSSTSLKSISVRAWHWWRDGFLLELVQHPVEYSIVFWCFRQLYPLDRVSNFSWCNTYSKMRIVVVSFFVSSGSSSCYTYLSECLKMWWTSPGR